MRFINNIRNSTFYRLITAVAFSMFFKDVNAQANTQRTNLLFVVDASFSMKKDWEGGTKWRTAVRTLSEIADSISQLDNVYIGLRLFGHQYDETESNCRDTKLEIPLTNNGKGKFQAKLATIRPKGITPIAYSVEKAVNDFGEDYTSKNILILITDGEESCAKDPCKISRELQERGIILKPFVITLGLPPRIVEMFNCFGENINVNSDQDFNRILKNIVNETIAKTTVTVNLLDKNSRPTETGCAMTFYDHETNIAKLHTYHTLNGKGLPDTMIISPLFDYDIQVHTLPELWLRNLKLKKNRHNEYNVNAAQGFLSFALQGASPSKSSLIERIKCLVHKKDTIAFFHAQSLNTEVKYLAGKYDLEILTLPRIYLNNISVDPNKTTHIEIPQPGFLTINKGTDFYGAVFVENKGVLQKLYDLKTEIKQEILTLQPGDYRIVYRSKLAKSGHNTIDKAFTITGGSSVSIRL
jgi:Ca-activated chloride channel family protein